MGYRPRTDKNGYELSEVISALQKEIRLGNEEEAMFWALEMVPKYEAYLWRRLIIITNEDIGIANPQLLQIIPAIANSYTVLREGGRGAGAKLLIANAILLMSRSPKCRMADHFGVVVNYNRQKGLHLEIPDYALDKHTNRGKSMGRGYEHWLEHGTLLKPMSNIEDPYAEAARKAWLDPSFDKLPQIDWKGKSSKSKQKSLFDQPDEETGTSETEIDE